MRSTRLLLVCVSALTLTGCKTFEDAGFFKAELSVTTGIPNFPEVNASVQIGRENVEATNAAIPDFAGAFSDAFRDGLSEPEGSSGGRGSDSGQ